MATQARIHPVTDPSGVLAVVTQLDDLYHTVMASLPDATGCNIAYTYTSPSKKEPGVPPRPVFEITVSFKSREDADFAIRLVQSGSIVALRQGFTAEHSVQTGRMAHRVVIRQAAA